MSDKSDRLVVVSKVKKHIRTVSGLNTSEDAIQALSDAVEKLCKKGTEAAQESGRKTVMARDISIEHI